MTPNGVMFLSFTAEHVPPTFVMTPNGVIFVSFNAEHVPPTCTTQTMPLIDCCVTRQSHVNACAPAVLSL